MKAYLKGIIACLLLALILVSFLAIFPTAFADDDPSQDPPGPYEPFPFSTGDSGANVVSSPSAAAG